MEELLLYQLDLTLLPSKPLPQKASLVGNFSHHFHRTQHHCFHLRCIASASKQNSHQKSKRHNYELKTKTQVRGGPGITRQCSSFWVLLIQNWATAAKLIHCLSCTKRVENTSNKLLQEGLVYFCLSPFSGTTNLFFKSVRTCYWHFSKRQKAVPVVSIPTLLQLLLICSFSWN